MNKGGEIAGRMLFFVESIDKSHLHFDSAEFTSLSFSHLKICAVINVHLVESVDFLADEILHAGAAQESELLVVIDTRGLVDGDCHQVAILIYWLFLEITINSIVRDSPVDGECVGHAGDA